MDVVLIMAEFVVTNVQMAVSVIVDVTGLLSRRHVLLTIPSAAIT